MGITTTIGNYAEDAAVDFLRKKGFMILERNWRSGQCEIDIIAQHWDTIHFVEVKSRAIGGWITPEESIDQRKINALRRCARAYLALKRIKIEYQFDLVAVDTIQGKIEELRYIEHLFEEHW